ncbi:MAG: hypothetical protein ACRYFS_13555 [Janthinobacterium lividum]
MIVFSEFLPLLGPRWQAKSCLPALLRNKRPLVISKKGERLTLERITLALAVTLTVALSICTPALAAKRAISPGRSIGQVSLGETLDAVTKTLGQPTGGGEATMGLEWDTWGGKSSGPNAEATMGDISSKLTKNEVDVYTDIYAPYPDGHPNSKFSKLVTEIRITSPWFLATGDVGVGSKFGQLLQQYPDLTRAVHTKLPSGEQMSLYDAAKEGIAFQVADSGASRSAWRCVAVIVHPRGRGVVPLYGGYYWGDMAAGNTEEKP